MKDSTNEPVGTVALVIGINDQEPRLVEAISDEEEIAVLDSAVTSSNPNPMDLVQRFRERRTQEEEEFGDYVESLLTQGHVPQAIQEHGIAWFKSKQRIEEYRDHEAQATKIIADFAFQVFLENTRRREFVLSGPRAKVLVKIYCVTAEVAEDTSVA